MLHFSKTFKEKVKKMKEEYTNKYTEQMTDREKNVVYSCIQITLLKNEICKTAHNKSSLPSNRKQFILKKVAWKNKTMIWDKSCSIHQKPENCTLKGTQPLDY